MRNKTTTFYLNIITSPSRALHSRQLLSPNGSHAILPALLQVTVRSMLSILPLAFVGSFV